MQHRIAVIITILASLLTGAAAFAGQPMDLTRTDARWVTLEVVATSPAAAESRMSQQALAWYEPGPGPSQRTVTVPARQVETILFANRSPVAGSFSNFVWVIDAESGHVESAWLEGELMEPVRVGPLRVDARVSILLELSTRRAGGYRQPRSFAGRTLVDYCADPQAPDCHAVATQAYDARSGWVRANGSVCASWRAIHSVAYTPIGHARFEEVGPRLEARASRVPPKRVVNAHERAGDVGSC